MWDIRILPLTRNINCEAFRHSWVYQDWRLPPPASRICQRCGEVNDDIVLPPESYDELYERFHGKRELFEDAAAH